MSTTEVAAPPAEARFEPGVPGGVRDADDLLAQAAAGDVAAFDSLYGQFSGQVFGVALRLLIDRHQAQEVAQEVWLQIWQQAGRFDPRRGSAAAWVMRIAHARAVDRIRSANASRLRDTAAAARNHLTAADVVVESVLLTIEQARVREQLPQLPDKQRQSINLAYFEGLTNAEISELLAIPLATVKTRIRDGLIRLGKLLAMPTVTTP